MVGTHTKEAKCRAVGFDVDIKQGSVVYHVTMDSIRRIVSLGSLS